MVEKLHYVQVAGFEPTKIFNDSKNLLSEVTISTASTMMFIS